MRITTNAILRDYRSNLGASIANLDTVRKKVMTGRQFVSSSENPGNALRAATLERKYVKNQDYLSTVDNAQTFLDSQESAAMQISDIALTLSKRYGIEALNGTNYGSLEVRKTYADAWRGAQESMLLSLNASYEGRYVFGAADAANPPFSLTTNADGSQTLTYRGVNVDPDPTDPNYQQIMDTLDSLSKENVFLDMGFGLSIKNGEIDPSSAFNTSLPGINLAGFGKTDSGISKNIILLAGQIADSLEKEPFDRDEFKELLDVFNDGRNNVLEKVTTLGSKSQFLSTTKDRLESDELNLTTQLDNVVNIDMADAITQYSWAQYAYNAALKVGTSILSPSFIDFMK